MGLYRRGHTWWISYQVAGRQRRESSGSTNKRVAERILAMRKTQELEDRLGLPRTHTPTLKEFSAEYLAGIVHPRTKDRYTDSVNALIAFFGDVRIGEVRADAIMQFQRARLADGRRPATVNRDTSVLSGILRKAKKLRLVTRNPCEDIDHLNELQERRKAQPLAFEEEETLLRFCPPLLRVLVILLIETGLRPKREALQLTWRDVDFTPGRASIVVRSSKTAAGQRRVPLTTRAERELTEWRRSQPSKSEWVFAAPRNPDTHWCNYQDAWERATEAAGLRGRRVYDLRSTFATRLHAAYPNDLVVARLMGHSTAVLLPVYAKGVDEVDMLAIQGLEKFRNSKAMMKNQTQ